MCYSIEPVAFVQNSRKELIDDDWGGVVSFIELAEHIHEASIEGIREFPHLEIIYYFNRVDEKRIQYEARYPRKNKEYPQGRYFCAKR